MLEDTMQQAPGQSWAGAVPRSMPMAMCPMAKACDRMMKKPPSRFVLMLPGALLILLGVFIFFEPRIVVWLAGTAVVLLGIMLLVMAQLIGRLRSPPR
jgi:uncharacterized membrane protein HdeD (DUF308 family)